MEKTKEMLKELEMEAPATRKCLERIPDKLFDWKPHPNAMPMKSLAMTVADIPNWIAQIIESDEIDFATYERFKIENAADILERFNVSMERARRALQNAKDDDLVKNFELKHGGMVLSGSPKGESVSSTINHLVHHRGQLTVYMRMNDIPVPAIYGPSGDDNSWG